MYRSPVTAVHRVASHHLLKCGIDTPAPKSVCIGVDGRQPKFGEMDLTPNGNNRRSVSKTGAQSSIRPKTGYPGCPRAHFLPLFGRSKRGPPGRAEPLKKRFKSLLSVGLAAFAPRDPFRPAAKKQSARRHSVKHWLFISRSRASWRSNRCSKQDDRSWAQKERGPRHRRKRR